MRKLLLLLLILLPALHVSAEEINALMLHLSSGHTATIPLDANPSISVNGENIAVSTDIWKVNIPSANVLAITYESVDIPGDVNLDKKINISDVSQAIKVLNGSGQISTLYDVNKDGTVNAKDVEEIGSLIIGKKIIIDGKVSSNDIQDSEGTQNADNAMYVYRNDGEFNAFLKSEVDSMVCSCYDTDSVDNKDIQMQVIYTPDSIYRIPLSAIDSISFVTPKTILNKDVFMLTSTHDKYLSECDTEGFTLATSTPSDMRPKEGDIVVSNYDCTSFPDGIMARVEEVWQDEDGIYYYCERVSLDDVYDQIVYTGYAYIYNDKDSTARAKAQNYLSITKVLWDKKWEDTLEDNGTKTTVCAKDKAFAKFTIMKQNCPLYFRLDLQNDLKTTFDFDATQSFAYYAEKPLVENLKIGRIIIPTDPIPIVIIPKFSLYAFFMENARVSLKLSAHYDRTDKVTFEYKNKEWSARYKPTQDAGLDVASLSLNGEIGVGFAPDILFSLYGSNAGLGLRGAVGLKESADFEFDAIEAFDEGVYSAMKDSYVRTTMPEEMDIYVQAGMIDKDSYPYDYPFYENEPQLGTDKYLLPLFTEPEFSQGALSSTAVLKTEASRDLLFPVSVGMAYYDGDTKLSTDYMSVEYQNEEEWPFEGIVSSFNEMEAGKTYTAYPLVKIMDKELRAEPSCEFEYQFPVTITSFRVTSKDYSPGAYYNEGAKYDYKFSVAATVAISEGIDISTVADWGYVYKDPNGNIKRISLKGEKSPYTDCRYAYYRNAANSTVCLYPYILFAGESICLDGDPMNYCLIYGSTSCPDGNHPHMIDLGLPSGTKWCCMNVGATSPEGYGGYYAWGETEEKSVYSADTYKYCYTVYIANIGASYSEYRDIGEDIAGTPYDVARVKMGDSWVMPSYTQQQELIKKCTREWTQQNGVAGTLVTGPNGAQIFLPAAGIRWDSELDGAGSEGNYWLSTCDQDKESVAFSLFFNSDKWARYYTSRFAGLPVRAVCP